MSDAEKLKDAITELCKAKKETDDKLSKVVEESRQVRQEATAQSNR